MNDGTKHRWSSFVPCKLLFDNGIIKSGLEGKDPNWSVGQSEE